MRRLFPPWAIPRRWIFRLFCGVGVFLIAASASDLAFGLNLGYSENDLIAAVVVLCGGVAIYILTNSVRSLLEHLFNSKNR